MPTSSIPADHLPPEVVDRWVAALESGQFEQGIGELHSADEQSHQYCCLGVLGCVLGVEWREVEHDPVSNTVRFGIEDRGRVEHGILPERYWPTDMRSRVTGKPLLQTDFATLNDGQAGDEQEALRRHSFAEIAEFIRAHVPTTGR